MPVELFVPIGIFLLGVLVAMSASNLGIQRLVQSQKNS